MARGPLTGNRWARPELRQARKARGWSLELAAGRAGISRVFLGNVERRDCRASLDHQHRLGELYGLAIDDLFEAQASVRYALPPRRGKWYLASEVERLLELTGEGVRELVRRGILHRRGGSSRYQFLVSEVDAITPPPGSLTLAQLSDRTGFTLNQLRLMDRHRELPTFTPWSGAYKRVRAEDVAALDEQLAGEREREEHRPDQSGQGEALRRFFGTSAGKQHLAARIAGFAERVERARVEVQRLKAQSLLDTEQVAQRLRVTTGTVNEYVRRGLLHPEVETIEGLRRLLFSDTEVKRFEHVWALALYDNPKSRLWQEPDSVVEWYRSRGLLDKMVTAHKFTSIEEAEAIIRDRVLRRTKQLKNRRRGRREGASPKPGYHSEWEAAYQELKAELDDRFEIHHVAGDRPPGKLEVALLVACDDYLLHPERWTYDPNRLPGEAARRVWDAIKSLQNAVSRNLAA